MLLISATAYLISLVWKEDVPFSTEGLGVVDPCFVQVNVWVLNKSAFIQGYRIHLSSHFS